MDILKCIFYDSDCYKEYKKITPKGIVVHSTGVNQTALGRYIQPSAHKDVNGLLEIIGKNTYNNHWNRPGVDKAVHAMIGKDASGDVRIVQCLPWGIAGWGVASGERGSYNYEPTGHIQFEMLEDEKDPKNPESVKYFHAVYQKAVELCAYLCHLYNLTPETIVSHKECHDLGYGSNHSDPHMWFSKFNKNMDNFRKDVEREMANYFVKIGPFATKAEAEKMKLYFEKAEVETQGNDNTGTSPALKVGDKVRLLKDAVSYGKTTRLADWVYNTELYVREIDGNRIVVSIYKSGAITGAVDKKYLQKL